MEMQLSSLIEKIKKEGVEQARRNSEEILKEAQEKKKQVINNAEEKASLIIKEAEEKAAKLKDNSEKAIAQALRDAILSFKGEIKDILDNIIKREVQEALTDEFIADLIIKIAAAWTKDKKTALEIMVNQQDKKRLEELVLSKFKKELTSGITFKVNPNVSKGLYIGIKGEDVYYDLTDKAILEILKQYLRPFIIKIMESRKDG